MIFEGSCDTEYFPITGIKVSTIHCIGKQKKSYLWTL